jgi:hypothetical protein
VRGGGREGRVRVGTGEERTERRTTDGVGGMKKRRGGRGGLPWPRQLSSLISDWAPPCVQQ